MSEVEFELRKLGDLIEIYNNKRVPLSAKQREGLEKIYPYYGAQGIVDYVDDYIFDGKYILIAEDGENLKSNNKSICTLATGKYWVNNHAHIIKGNDETNTDFLYYKLNSISFAPYITGSAQPKLNKENLLNIELYVPSKEYQDKIAKVLTLLDQKIQINNQINQELEAMAKTLYNYWFVQFDFPDQNGKPYKSSGGKMVYNPELKREIPEGWGVESVVDNTLSKVIKPGIDHFTQKTYLATGDVVNTSIKDGRLITFENRETRANMQPSVNSVWFAKMKSSNKHLFLSHSMKELIDSTILSTGFMGLQCKEESFEYIASFISDPNFEIFKDTLSHGATQEAVNIDDLRSVPVIIPDDYILREFHRIAKSIFLNLGRNMIEDKTLSSLRDWLLPMLMNGQVKVE